MKLSRRGIRLETFSSILDGQAKRANHHGSLRSRCLQSDQSKLELFWATWIVMGTLLRVQKSGVATTALAHCILVAIARDYLGVRKRRRVALAQSTGTRPI